MKTAIIVILLTLTSLIALSQEIEFLNDGSIKITSERVFESVHFRMSTGIRKTENEAKASFVVEDNELLMSDDMLDFYFNEVVIIYIDEIVLINVLENCM